MNKNGGPSQRHKIMLTHGLRKFFKKQCRRAGVDAVNLEYMVGHRTGNPEFGVTSLMMTYDPAIEEELLKEYMKAIDNLTIDPANMLQMQVKELEVKAKAGEKVEALEKIVADGAMKNDAMLRRIAEQEQLNKRMETKMEFYDQLLSDPKKLRELLESQG